jgi:hypothetical protein
MTLRVFRLWKAGVEGTSRERPSHLLLSNREQLERSLTKEYS